MTPSENPYRPPSADLSTGPHEALPLYSPGQIGGVTLLGGPLAGAFLLAANYAGLNDATARTRTLAIGLLGSIAFFALAIAVPAGLSRPLPIVSVIAMRSIADSLQGERYRKRLAAGGRRYSNWRVAGLGALFLVATLAAFVVLILAFPDFVPEE